MAYCNPSDVASEFKNLSFSSSTNPTDTVVNSFIAQADAEIDGKVGLRYAVPIDTVACPVSAITLKQLSVWLVAARVKEILKVKTGDEGSSQEARAGDLAKTARAQLDQIAQGEFLLRDAPLLNTTEGLAGWGMGAGEVLQFDKNTDQW